MYKHPFSLAIMMMIGVLWTSQSLDAQSYPWRSNSNSSDPTASPTRVRSRVAAPLNRRSTRPNPVLVSFANQENQGGGSVLLDQQPSVSDVPTPAPRSVPSPEPQPRSIQLGAPQDQGQVVGEWVSQGAGASIGNSVVASPAPGLLIDSNASLDAAPNYCDRNCRKPCCLGCERKLFGQTCNGFEIGGWLASGYHNRDNGLFNNHRGDINVSQFWMYAGRQASRDTGSWDVGFRLDALYGVDAQDLQAIGNSPTGAPTGWDNSWDNGRYGFALPQAYVQFANYDWDVKVGKFIAPFGYEGIGAANNFFYSRSFTRFHMQPFTLSGVLGERSLSDNRSVLVGLTSGWDTGFDNNDGGNLILGVRRNLGPYIQQSFTASVGDTGFRDTGIYTSAVNQFQLTDSLRYVLQTDVQHLKDNQEFGIVHYLFRDVTQCLGLGARLEWWKSDRFFGGATSSTYGFTMGANYRASANLTIRPEVRFDWGAAAVNNGEAIIGIDAVLTF